MQTPTGPVVITLQPWEIATAVTLFLALCATIAAVVRFLWKLDMSVQNGTTALGSLARSFDCAIETLTAQDKATNGRVDELWKALAELLPTRQQQ